MDRYGIGEDCVPKLLKETENDIRERRPVYGGFLHIIPLTRMAGDIVTLLYLPTALQLPDQECINKLDGAFTKWQLSLASIIDNKAMIANAQRGNIENRENV